MIGARVPRRAALGVALLALLGATTTACTAGGSAGWHGAPPLIAPSASAPASAPPSPSAPASPSPSGSARDTCVASVMAGMSLKQIAGQVMLVGTPVTDIDSVVKTMKAYDIGGIFIAGRSKAPAAKLKSAISALQAAAPEGNQLLIALDQEGGEVQTLQGPDFPPIPTAVTQGKLGADALGKQASAWAAQLAAIGVNLDLAPVADTVPASLGKGNPPIGGFQRQYGSDPNDVAASIRTLVPAIQSTGVMTTLKHFPGLGRVRVNTDYDKGAVDTVATVDDPYLGPFQAGIKAKSTAVMISSASYPNLDPDHIGAFSSKIITGLLRQRLGFRGVIVSDSLAGAAAVSDTPARDRAKLFIQAGGDLALTTQASKAATMVAGILAEAQASSAFKTRLADAARHVLDAKYAAGLLGCSPKRG